MSRNFVLMIIATIVFFCVPTCYGAGSKIVGARVVDRGLLWDAFSRTWKDQTVRVPPELVSVLSSKKVKITCKFLCHLFPDDSIKKDVKISNSRARVLMKCHYGKEEYFTQQGITLQNKKVHAQTGVMVADMTYKNITSNKSFFPSCWSRSYVMIKIIEAFRHPIEGLIPEATENTGNTAVFGKTRENIVIKMIINQCGELITAFPDAKMNGLS